LVAEYFLRSYYGWFFVVYFLSFYLFGFVVLIPSRTSYIRLCS